MPDPSQSAASTDAQSATTNGSRNANGTAAALTNDDSTAKTDGLTTEELQKLSEQSGVSSALKLSGAALAAFGIHQVTKSFGQ